MNSWPSRARATGVVLLSCVFTVVARAAVAQDAPTKPPETHAADTTIPPPNPDATPVAQDERLLGPGRALELTLDGALEIALKNNLGLKIEALSAQVALYNYRGSWGTFDWQVTAKAGVTDAQFQPRDVFGGSSENDQTFSVDFARPLETTGGQFGAHFDTTNTRTNSAFAVQPLATTDVISLTYAQPLLRGAWHDYATSLQRESELQWRRADEHQRQIRQRLLLDVSIAYWNLVSARAQLEVAQSSVGLAQKQVDQNQRRLDAGLGTEVEVLQAHAEVASREEKQLAADVAARQAADDLKQLVFPGTDAALWETSLIPSTPLPAAVSAEVAPLWSSALVIAVERRSELRQQRLQIDALAIQHDRTRSEALPGLDLDLTASSQGFSGKSADAFDTTARYEFPTYKAALVFNYPIGNTSARNSERAAWTGLRQARLQYDDLESRIAAEVRGAVRQVVYQAEAVRAAEKSRELAQRQLSAEEARYDLQMSTTFQVLQFQQDLALSMSSEQAARANYAKALVAVRSAQGLLGETQTP